MANIITNKLTVRKGAKKVFSDEAYKKAVVKSKAPLEFINEGYEKECKAYVENITKVGQEYRSLLSG